MTHDLCNSRARWFPAAVVLTFCTIGVALIAIGWAACMTSLWYQRQTAELQAYRAQRNYYHTQADLIIKGAEPKLAQTVDLKGDTNDD